MDALPVAEETGLSFASTAKSEYEGRTVPVMHACGHDNHTAILMGVATVLAGMRDELPGTVKFVFQPAEEGVPTGEKGGAEMMVQEGVLENPHVDAIFGLHVMQIGAVGEAFYRARGAMAASARFDITVHGRQTHGAMPWAGVDPVVVGAAIVTELQTIVSRRVDITQAPAIVTVGSFNAGVRNNIVPEEAKLSGTIRTFDPAATALVRDELTKIATGVGAAMGAAVDVQISQGNPVTFNDPALTARMVPTLARVYGAEHVRETQPITAAEDFSLYQEKVPGLFFFVGVRDPAVPAAQAVPNHSPRFDADERALENAVRAMASLAVDFLTGG
jgi:amidohydrolase